MHIPKQYTETHPGVIERKEYFSSEEFYKNYNDLEDYKRIIDADLPHYQRMCVDNPFPDVVGKYDNILSIGGGIPKIETFYLKANYVRVVDMKAEIYQQLLPYFREKYNVDSEIKYVHFEYDPLAECVSFVHFLEHLQWNDIKELISSQTTDIFIYMPNIEAAKNDDWFHFAGFQVDHNTFFTMDAMKELGESLGYKFKGKAYHDDMFIWLYK
jgi:hypothetical protein